MSRVDALDLPALVARLRVAISGDWAGSPYLLAVGCLFLACDPRSVGELGMLDSIFRLQCEAEAIEADPLLDALAEVTP